MHCVTLSLSVLLWTALTKLCGAWVHPFQNALIDRPATASERVHKALVDAEIIPGGKFFSDDSIVATFPSKSPYLQRLGEHIKSTLLIASLVLDDFQPSVYVTLSYASRHKSVDLGNKIKPKKVSSSPVFTIDASAITPTRTLRSNTTYTLVLSDPDATSRAEPVMAQMCHWIVTNLTLPLQSSNSDKALDWLLSLLSTEESKDNGIEEIMPYLPPTPPPKTGYHRYVFVLLAPATEGGTRGELTKPKDRPHWGYGKVGAGIREWADENGLVAVGANFFYSKSKKQ